MTFVLGMIGAILSIAAIVIVMALRELNYTLQGIRNALRTIAAVQEELADERKQAKINLS